jgi:rare lipoprotein A
MWAFMLVALLLLGGCSSMSRRDGPPPFNVDESKIPDAVPKVEPLSRSGNQPSYTVFGRRYYVMRSSTNYEERGIASWYGTKFHSHHTSSGERYNMLAMTAAHKSLPLPTYVQVTNLSNGRQVIVKVNDRGPFESNRLIDLSYVAAKKLGMLGHGTAYVDIKAINPSEFQLSSLFARNKTASKPTMDDHPMVYAQEQRHHGSRLRTKHHTMVARANLYLQVGAFRNKTHAEKLKVKLVALQHSPVMIHPSKNMYHVRVGPFKDIATAERLSKQLKAHGIYSKRVAIL